MFLVTVISFLILHCLHISNAVVTQQKIAVPAYFHPSGAGAEYWNRITTSAQVGLAVLNPSSGPGNTQDAAYAKVIKDGAKNGRKIVGYVDTGYFGFAGCGTGCKTRGGSTDPKDWTVQIKGDIDKFYELYGTSGLSGIFLDDGLNTCGTNNQYFNYYKSIYGYIKTKHSGGFVVLNPGSGVEQCYAAVADVLIVFESNFNAYRSWQQPSWSQNQPNAMQFWHLIYNVTTEQDMKSTMDLSKQKNAGYVYVTPDNLPNPWDTLPDSHYWTAELQKAQG